MQNEQLTVCGVVWDGMHFSAYSQKGLVSGFGKIEYNKAYTGGIITGTIHNGNNELNGRKVSISFQGEDGTCTFLT